MKQTYIRKSGFGTVRIQEKVLKLHGKQQRIFNKFCIHSVEDTGMLQSIHARKKNQMSLFPILRAFLKEKGNQVMNVLCDFFSQFEVLNNDCNT